MARAERAMEAFARRAFINYLLLLLLATETSLFCMLRLQLETRDRSNVLARVQHTATDCPRERERKLCRRIKLPPTLDTRKNVKDR